MAGGGAKKKHGEHHDLALTLTAVLVVGGVMGLQMIARGIKRRCEGKHHAADILEASERELSVLGLIAFGLFVLEQAAWLQGDWLGVFHEVHFALFTVALCYVALNVSLYRLSRSRGRLWHRYELNAADPDAHAVVVKRFQDLRTQLQIPTLEHHWVFGAYWLKGLFRHPFLWLEYQRSLEELTFAEVRRDFLRVHHLPHAFSFAAYLETCLQHVCLEFSEIRDTVWFLGILGLIAHLFVTTVTTTPSAETTLTWLGTVVIFLCVLAFFKVKWIYWFILHSELLFSTPGNTAKEESKETALTLTSSKRGRLSSQSENAEAQLALFWFKNPSFVVTLLELCLFALASCAALLIYKMKSFYKSGDLAMPFSVIAAAVVIMVLLLPRIVPRFTLITHVGALADPRRIASVIHKQHKRGDLDHERPSVKKAKTLKHVLVSRTSSLRDATVGLSHRVTEAVEDPRISNASAMAVVAFVFLVAVTLDENSAASVMENGHVLVIRDIEIVLGCGFVIESLLRLWYRPKDRARQIDVLLVLACIGCNLASFILRPDSPSKALHAASAAIVLRIFNTAWHNEIAKPRLEHLQQPTSKNFLPKMAADDDDIEASPEPAWVKFYANEPSSSVSLDALGGGEGDENKERQAAAERRAVELLKTALASASSDSSGAVDDVVDRAFRLALRGLVGDTPQTIQDELEDALYFNHVLKIAQATTGPLEPSHSSVRDRIFGLLSGPAETSSTDVVAVQLLLTRDQLLWYDITKYIAALGDDGSIVHVPAKSTDITAVANDSHPDGELHLSTILKVDAADARLLITTTSHVAAFHLTDTSTSAAWKAAILNAIESHNNAPPPPPPPPTTTTTQSSGTNLVVG